MSFDADRLAQVLATAVEAATAPLVARIAMLEQRAAKAFDVLTEKAPSLVGPPGPPGPAGERGADGAAGINGTNGTDGAEGRPGPPGAAGAQGEPGPRGDPGMNGKDGQTGAQGLVGPPGAAGEKGLDGINGRDGVAGRDGLPGVPGPQGEKGLDGMHGKDGSAGKDGRDGTLEHLKAEFDGERMVTLCFKNGDPIEGGVIRFPTVIDRGVWKAAEYAQGDGVTWGGSFWIAQQATNAKPGEPGAESRAWRLAVKKGADGKPGPQGEPGAKGMDGRPGRDGRYS